MGVLENNRLDSIRLDYWVNSEHVQISIWPNFSNDHPAIIAQIIYLIIYHTIYMYLPCFAIIYTMIYHCLPSFTAIYYMNLSIFTIAYHVFKHWISCCQLKLPDCQGSWKVTLFQMEPECFTSFTTTQVCSGLLNTWWLIPRIVSGLQPGYKWDKWGQCPLKNLGWTNPLTIRGISHQAVRTSETFQWDVDFLYP